MKWIHRLGIAFLWMLPVNFVVLRLADGTVMTMLRKSEHHRK